MFARHARAQAALKIFEGIWSKETVFVYVFSVLMVFCNSFPSFAGQDAGMEIYSTDKRRSLFSPPDSSQDRTSRLRFYEKPKHQDRGNRRHNYAG